MKLKKTLTLVILSTLLFLGLSSLGANASAWKKGIPDSINSPITQPWISNRKSGTWGGKDGKHGYSKSVLITNDQIAGSQRNYFSNGKPNDATPYWYKMYTNPYYKITGKDTYRVKDKSDSGQLIIKKLSKNKMKVWGKITVDSYGYLGIYTKNNLDIYSKINSSN